VGGGGEGGSGGGSVEEPSVGSGGSGAGAGASGEPLDAGSAGRGGGGFHPEPKDAASDGPSSGAGDGMKSSVGTEGDGDFTIGPTYLAHPDVFAKANNPHGKIYKFALASQGTLFDGLDKSLAPANQHAFSRNVWLYVPQQYRDGDAAPFMVVQDGEWLVEDVKNTLDNLIAGKKVPVVLAVLVHNGGGDGQDSERGLEYDTMSDRYARFIDANVLPAARNQPAVKADYPNLRFTEDPEGRATYGCSSGGSAALSQGWFAPQRYRRIITYSGTFVSQQDNQGIKAPEAAAYPYGAWEYHSDKALIANNAIKPLRVFLNVGENDLNLDARAGDMRHNWIVANQWTAAALRNKGYHYRFVFAKGAGHCDSSVRRATLPDTLTWMWRGYEAP